MTDIHPVRVETWEKQHGRGYSTKAEFRVYLAEDDSEHVSLDAAAFTALLKEAGFVWVRTAK